MPIVEEHIRKAVFNRDGWYCHYCDERLFESATVDHKVPVCRGGTDEMSNLVACCGWCNVAKNDIPYKLFVAIREEVGYGPSSRSTIAKRGRPLLVIHEGASTPAMERCAMRSRIMDCFRIDWSNPPQISARPRKPDHREKLIRIRKGPKNHSVNREKSYFDRKRAERLKEEHCDISAAHQMFKQEVAAYWRGERDSHPSGKIYNLPTSRICQHQEGWTSDWLS